MDIGFARRLQNLRIERGLTIQKLAAQIGCDRGYLSRLETGKAINPSLDLVRRAAAVLGVTEHWLGTGLGDPFEGDAPPGSEGERIQFSAAIAVIAENMTLDELLRVAHAIASGPSFTPAARSFWLGVLAPWLAMRADRDKRNELTERKAMLDSATVTKQRRSYWHDLRERLRIATTAHGHKAALAREFNVTPQAVAEWLSGASAPTAETTLRLVEWVTAAEAKQKRAGSADTRPARKTRKRKSITPNEKAKSNRKQK